MPKPIKKTRPARRDKKSASSAPVSETARRMEYGPEERALFNNAIHIAGVVVRTFGHLCEVAVHDFRDLEHSLIHIEGSLTGRKPGAPITNIVTKAWRQGGNGVEDIVAYPTSTPSGKTLKSSTSFIRNSRGAVIGAFCLNFDLTGFERFQSVLHSVMHYESQPGKVVSEAFASCMGETSEAIIETAIKRAGKHPAGMNREEKKNFIRILDEEGAFLIKGMVQYLAKTMQVSIYTVYNYMRELKKESSE
ncbi:helix-turn-helix transcriptional regulator [Desulfovibrio porci]|uniref:helix-turn-helix transcriptional regulator n=1 Tax=Desulfovibrio porci TaxID=2605782 RepID=UPI003A9561E5